jgi:hypothetical protein
MKRRKSFAGQEWSMRDLNFVGSFLVLLILGWRYLVFLYVAFALPVLWLALYGVRQWRLARDRKRNPREFWADKIS